MRAIPARQLLWIAVLAGLLGACRDTWLGTPSAPPIPGTRLDVLTEEPALKPDAADRKVILPAPEVVPDWPEAGGFAPHAMFHLALGGSLHRVWTASVGDGAEKRRAFITQPIAVAGTVYAMDAQSVVSAFDLRSGHRLWRTDLTVEAADNGSYGGGLAYDQGSLFVTDSFGQAASLNPVNGKVRWRKNLPAPVRGAPTARAGRLIVITVANQTVALAEQDGNQLWTHSGLEEETSMLGGNSPAIYGNTVVVPYSSGEIYALRVENGSQLWDETLAVVKRTNEVATLTDIPGLPVLDRGRVYAAANSDVVAALDLSTGRRIWDRNVGSIQTPWVAGNFLFVVTNTPSIVCFRADTGEVVWVTPLAQWTDPEDKTERITWTGAVLASDRLIIAGSNGEALSVSPYTGRIMGKIELPDGVTIPPIVVDRTLIFLTDEGELVAYR